MTALVVLGFFLFVMAAVAAGGWLLLFRNNDVVEGGLAEEGPSGHGRFGFLMPWLRWLGERVPDRKANAESYRTQLAWAGYREPAALTIFHGIRAASALALGCFTLWAVSLWKSDLGAALIPALCTGGFGYLLPRRILKIRIRARAQRLRRGLPAALDLMALIVEAGQPMEAALHETANALHNVYPDLSGELAYTYLQTKAGKNRYEALRALADRTSEAEVRRLSTLLTDSDRFGASLAPSLRTHSRYLRTRLRQQSQETARKLTVKLIFPVFFLIFPSVMLVTLGPAFLQLRKELPRLLGN